MPSLGILPEKRTSRSFGLTRCTFGRSDQHVDRFRPIDFSSFVDGQIHVRGPELRYHDFGRLNSSAVHSQAIRAHGHLPCMDKTTLAKLGINAEAAKKAAIGRSVRDHFGARWPWELNSHERARAIATLKS
jgi:hypothetical protein